MDPSTDRSDHHALQALARQFDELASRLEDWYRDDVQAQSYEGGPGTTEHGHAVLQSQAYPGAHPRRLWANAQTLVDRAQIIHDLENELYAISHGASKAGPSSGLHPGTAEFDYAVATAEGSLRAVARRFGVSRRTIYLWLERYGLSRPSRAARGDDLELADL